MTADLTFLVDHQMVATRPWSQVPRVGELVELRGSLQQTLRVVQVRWILERGVSKSPWIEIEMERLTP